MNGWVWKKRMALYVVFFIHDEEMAMTIEDGKVRDTRDILRLSHSKSCLSLKLSRIYVHYNHY